MIIVEPLAILAAIAALIAAQGWWAVAKVADRHGSDAARVNRKLYLAALMTMIALGLAASAVLASPLLSVIS